MKIAILGDSLAYGTGDESDGGIAGRIRSMLPDIESVNLGVSGAVTSDVARRLNQTNVRSHLKNADVIVLSIGANDLFRTPGAQQRAFEDPMKLADEILAKIAHIVSELQRISPHARILLLGGYNPVPDHPLAFMIDGYVEMWDELLVKRFEVVKTHDLVIGANLSRYDRFHPGGPAYQAIAERIAERIAGMALPTSAAPDSDRETRPTARARGGSGLR
ncbi:MAG TPA: GDSL-type esterase/lipase family protein [Thermoanaerobaculia bacterium]|nr:GDSL-type esterase/lipase family protein [Thermoanaerobaculia bacterium]